MGPKAPRGRVLLQLNDNGYTTPGGIYVAATDASDRATITSVGDGVDEVSVGQTVVYNKHAAKDFDYEGQVYLCINVHDIMFIINESDK